MSASRRVSRGQPRRKLETQRGEHRVARNMATIKEIVAAYNEGNKGSEIVLEGLPGYDMKKGISAFLRSGPAAQVLPGG
jgi:hypothetical protein